ncbi:TPA: hypothetical protein DCZ32_04600 [Candidatus Uhrbacteria bacterium]|nr:hypothetical protein [Candidatus Uhrbacteria bacterium]
MRTFKDFLDRLRSETEIPEKPGHFSFSKEQVDFLAVIGTIAMKKAARPFAETSDQTLATVMLSNKEWYDLLNEFKKLA